MSDPIPRLNAALEGRYEIEREIGEGGMAIVYLARDLKHNRNVALKVLRPELAAVVGAERFLAEIETTANLQHPHILPLFDSGEADSFLFYVMPYIDGETLRDRLDREKQLPVDEAIGIATAVANALQTAHAAGVVHRDIKPANILMSQGEPLVSDFGIALAVGAAGGNRLTETGLSVGTPYYMSPEQATGDQQIGPQSDTYALACVLYEMLVGEPPYTGNTAQAVLGKIIMGAPVSATAIRASIPANVDAAIRKALEKLPADRFTGAHDFARALADTGFRHGAAADVGAETGAPAGPWNPLTIGFAAVAAITAVVAFLGWSRPEPQPPPDEPAVRTHLQLGDIELEPVERIEVSRDGSRFAVVGARGGEYHLFVRNADEEEFRPIPGTEEAFSASFSPDGEWIAFAHDSDGTVFRVSVSGGAPRPVVTEDLGAQFVFWGDDGTIVFVGDRGEDDGIFRVADTGGEAELILTETGNQGLLNPRLLPGGEKLLVTDGAVSSTLILDIETDSLSVLIENGIDASYVQTGHLVYADAAGGLWAVPFDAEAGVLMGQPTPLLDGLSVWFNRFARYSVSENGTLVYGAGAGGGTAGRDQQLLIVDLLGNEEVWPLEPRLFGEFEWSPDGSTVAYFSLGEESNIFTYNVDLRTTPRQLTFEGDNFMPVWSPDGTRVAFASNREDTEAEDLFVKTVTDDTPPRLILRMPQEQYPTHWPSEDVLVFESGSDIWTMNPADSSSATPYLEAEAALRELRVSPDGDLAAYRSNETGEPAVYVSSFPTPRQPTRVSEGSGGRPRWSPDGSTLYYWVSAPTDTLYAARVQHDPTFSVLSREPLFAGTYSQGGAALHPEGDRWAIPQRVAAAEADDTGAERFLVVTNWFTELKETLGEGN
jgi:Tol biopolymer transport system component